MSKRWGSKTFHAWGKARVVASTAPARDTERVSPQHHLAHHSMDVAAVFLQLVGSTVARNRMETAAKRHLTEVDIHRLAALAFLHDIGKLHPAFQAKAWPEGYWHGALGGHTSESWSFVIRAAKRRNHPFHDVVLEMAPWGPIEPLLAAMFAHHGRPVAPSVAGWPSILAHYDWRAEAAVMSGALRQWFPIAFQPVAHPLPHEAPFHHLVAGFASLADWIGSNTQFFPYTELFSPNYDAVAHEQAQQALEAIGQSDRIRLPRSPSFQELTGFPTPNPAQDAIGAIEPAARLVILEAETGSGKTEAALWRFAKLFCARKVSSLYFALPTRAAARQLHGRVQTALDRLFGDDAPEAVLAIPGALKAGDHEGTRLPGWEVRWDDEAPAPNRWAAEHATRFLSAEVAVGTVDQAMLAGLMAKHAHMRGSALSRSLLVVDEVHASDSYMTAVLKPLVDDHLAVGGYVLLMSATLGAIGRATWHNEPVPPFADAKAAPYPAVWVRGESAPRVPKSTGTRAKEVRPQIVPTMAPERAARIARDAAQAGARVLLIRNTVQAAVETWQAVQDLGAGDLLLQVAGGPALHHGRFAAEDRALLDGAVERALARDRRSSSGCIVVGTQTLEQSLDIDADFLVTDLCPMDVLLQRIGRLHRHDLSQRPDGFIAAQAMIMVPEHGLGALVGPRFENGLGAWPTRNGDWHYIYGDLAVLELTRQLVAELSVWRIPEMNRDLVEGATHSDRVQRLLEEQGEAWLDYYSNVAGVEAARRMLGRVAALRRSEGYIDVNFPTGDERILTRLGKDGVVLDFDPVLGPFGLHISRIALPAHWSWPGVEDSNAEALIDGEGLVLRVGERLFNYTRAGVLTTQDLVTD
ncbi:MAG: CRISPR-associated helicase Cas3' [Gammaproteobacteria bacterium]|nr:CRISPR-associated helicase Cas3' [Gammaproteobacteria bacterium]